MTEDLHKETTGEESSSGGHRHHHRHHHHSLHEHSHRHHRSSHSSHRKSYGRHYTKTSQKNNKITSFFKNLSHKLTLSHGTPQKKIKKLATSTNRGTPDTYTVISRRVLFGAIFLAVIIYCIVSLFSDENPDIKNAGYTPSETSTLKKQVMQLELENAMIKEELERYKLLYGELTDEKENKEDTN